MSAEITQPYPSVFPKEKSGVTGSFRVHHGGGDVEMINNSIGYDPTCQGVTPETRDSVARLALMGYSARIEDADIPAVVPPEIARRVAHAITTREAESPTRRQRNFLDKFRPNKLKTLPLTNDLFDIDGTQGGIHKTGQTWLGQNKRAHSLIYISDPTYDRFGGNTDSNALHKPIFAHGETAAGIIRREKPEKAQRIIDKTERFIMTPVHIDDGKDRFGLVSWEYLRQVPDSVAVRKREELASRVIERHALNIPEVASGQRGLRISSLACGAGNMMVKLVKRFEEKSLRIDRVDYYDQDVVALAVAHSHAHESGIGDKVNIRRFDLLKGNASEDLKDVDVREMLGLFEYLPKVLGIKGLGYKLAADFLRAVGEGAKPGSLIVFGNMLKSRPHQTMFDQVWAKLQQRSPEEVINLIEVAGYPKDSISVHISDDGVYGVYVIKIPEVGEFKVPKRSKWQSLVRRVLLGTVKEY